MRNKVVLFYKNNGGEIAEETIWVQPSGDNYQVDNIPFLAPNLALNDIISVENDEGTLYFDQLIKPSGHSTVQVVFFKPNENKRVLKVIEQIGCNWEGMKENPYYAIDIPPNVNYNEVKSFLDREFNDNILDYKEACLSKFHR